MRERIRVASRDRAAVGRCPMKTPAVEKRTEFMQLFWNNSGTISVRSISHFDSSTADNNKGIACLFNTFSLSVFKPGSFVFLSVISTIPLSDFLLYEKDKTDLLLAV